jgi:mannosylglucosylglycerate synthase
VNGSSRIGFVSTRFAGTDGVSLETRKWADILEGLGHECFYFAGESDRPADRTMVVDEAAFTHPDILAITGEAFGARVRPASLTGRIMALGDRLKDALAAFVDEFGIDLLIAENALTIPMNIPLGMALTEYIAETHIPVIAHHHDFYWERDRFLVNCVDDLLTTAFPPRLESIHHVVINSVASMQLALRTGVSVRIVPNVMDFANPPAPPEIGSREVRGELGVGPGERLVLQPTRVVQRKGIEHAIELVRRLGEPAQLVVSHGLGDEGFGYVRRIREYADLLGVGLVFAGDRIRQEGSRRPGDGRMLALGDVYQAADLVTYPSTVEGFGNALVEAIYFRRPVVVNRYSIYSLDIEPKGFEMIEFDGYVTDATIAAAKAVMRDPDRAAEMTDRNYDLGSRFYSFQQLEAQLHALVREALGETG